MVFICVTDTRPGNNIQLFCNCVTEQMTHNFLVPQQRRPAQQQVYIRSDIVPAPACGPETVTRLTLSFMCAVRAFISVTRERRTGSHDEPAVPGEAEFCGACCTGGSLQQPCD